MTDAILTLNTGSSTIKFALYALASNQDNPQVVVSGVIDDGDGKPKISIHDNQGAALLEKALPDHSDHNQQLHFVLDWLQDNLHAYRLIGAGHRIVHGGATFTEPLILDDETLAQLEQLTPLAPLHQPYNLAAIHKLAETAPELPQIGCFDTMFHHSIPHLANEFALPRALTAEGVRRYGFHGLSYEYIAEVLPGYAGDVAQGRVVVAHLGSGASLCAMRNGNSVTTTMGFTALDGLPMAERCGNLDPGVLLYLMKEKGMDYDSLTQLLYHQSGLLGVSGSSGDLRTLLADRSPQAQEAVDLFVYRINRELGSLAAALGGIDVLVFTAGIGEHSPQIRAAVCAQAQWLGIDCDSAANQRGEHCISTRDSRVGVYVIATDENLMIARHSQRLLRQRETQSPK